MACELVSVIFAKYRLCYHCVCFVHDYAKLLNHYDKKMVVRWRMGHRRTH